MSVLSMAQWIQGTDFFTALRISWYVYPIVMTCHLIGISLFGGMILVGNMRLLGLAMTHRSISDVIGQLRVPKRIGFLIVATCGILLAGAKAEEYYYNFFFWTKMSILSLIAVHGLVFRRGVYQNTAELDAALHKTRRIPARAQLAATLSLILWTGMVIAGRGIGYVEPPIDKLHATLRQGEYRMAGRGSSPGSVLKVR